MIKLKIILKKKTIHAQNNITNLIRNDGSETLLGSHFVSVWENKLRIPIVFKQSYFYIYVMGPYLLILGFQIS